MLFVVGVGVVTALVYASIVASGPHAPILHWMRNTGVVKNGDMLLVDAGVEVDSSFIRSVSSDSHHWNGAIPTPTITAS